jgi:tryptophan synthase beta subunit
LAYVLEHGSQWRDRGPVVICLSGRGDKDVAEVAALDSTMQERRSEA